MSEKKGYIKQYTTGVIAGWEESLRKYADRLLQIRREMDVQEVKTVDLSAGTLIFHIEGLEEQVEGIESKAKKSMRRTKRGERLVPPSSTLPDERELRAEIGDIQRKVDELRRKNTK